MKRRKAKTRKKKKGHPKGSHLPPLSRQRESTRIAREFVCAGVCLCVDAIQNRALRALYNAIPSFNLVSLPTSLRFITPIFSCRTLISNFQAKQNLLKTAVDLATFATPKICAFGPLISTSRHLSCAILRSGATSRYSSAKWHDCNHSSSHLPQPVVRPLTGLDSSKTSN